MAFLTVKNLTKSFDGLAVLKGVDFELNKGEVLSIIGSSGNGKTTLMRCLNFLTMPDSGEIIVDGTTIFPFEDGKKSSSKLTFGMVFQNFNLFPQYNALENVTLAMNLKSKRDLKERLKAKPDKVENGEKVKKPSFKEKKAILKAEYEQNEQTAIQILTRVGLEDKLKNYPCELSGGQCQRVAIARALALAPDVLCFDEPTSALDPELTKEVLKVIKGLRDEGRTMIIITHEMAFARSVSDKVIFMADGVVEESGTPAQVFDNPVSEKTKAFFSVSNEQV